MTAPCTRILFVEGSAADAELAERHLREAGMTIARERADSRRELIRSLAHFKPEVVLCDLRTTPFDGLAALKAVVDGAPGVPVIILAGSISEDVAIACMKEGAADCIPKDHLARLAPAVRAALGRRLLLDEPASEALRQGGDRLRARIESSSDGVVLFGHGGTIEYASPWITRTLRYTPEIVLGQSIFNFVYPDDRLRLEQLVRNMAGDPDSVCSSVFRAFHRDGSYRWLQATARNALGVPVVRAVILSLRDIGERRPASQR